MRPQPMPLAGIKVIDYTHFLAGPYLTRCLASFGAEVIKVERPKAGDAARTHPYLVQGQSGYYLQQNMGKKGLCVNLKDARGLEMMHKLVGRADVFVENYRPGVLDKLGLGYADLSKTNPRLVYCSLSAYGHTGPDAQRPGFGVIAEARSGAMDLVGNPGEAPPLFRMPIADMYAGIHGVAAVCAALMGRHASNRGQHIDIALYDCMVSMHEFAVQCYTLSEGREIMTRSGHDLPQATVLGVFAARDGYVTIAAHADENWKRFAGLVGGTQLAADSRFHSLAGRNSHREELLVLTRAWVAQQSVQSCMSMLDAAEVPCAPVQRIDQVVEDPQTQARGMIIEQDHPMLGRVRLSNVPFKFSEVDATIRTAAPLLGQHNRDIGAELGYSAEMLETLEREGVLYADPAVN